MKCYVCDAEDEMMLRREGVTYCQRCYPPCAVGVAYLDLPPAEQVDVVSWSLPPEQQTEREAVIVRDVRPAPSPPEVREACRSVVEEEARELAKLIAKSPRVNHLPVRNFELLRQLLDEGLAEVDDDGEVHITRPFTPAPCCAFHDLHRKWTEAVGSPGYDKAKWKAAERELLRGHRPCGAAGGEA